MGSLVNISKDLCPLSCLFSPPPPPPPLPIHIEAPLVCSVDQLCSVHVSHFCLVFHFTRYTGYACNLNSSLQSLISERQTSPKPRDCRHVILPRTVRRHERHLRLRPYYILTDDYVSVSLSPGTTFVSIDRLNLHALMIMHVRNGK